MASAASDHLPIPAPSRRGSSGWKRPRTARTSLRPHQGEAQLKSWMIESLEGSASAQKKLLEAISTLLRSFYCRRLTRNEAEVEDLVQESLIAIHTRQLTYDRARPFTPWMYSIARHKLYDHFRGYGRTRTIEGLENLVASEGFELSSNARMDVDRLLEELPAPQARAIRQTRIAGLSIGEAARQSGIGESAVKVSVHRGLRALAARLQGSEHGI